MANNFKMVVAKILKLYKKLCYKISLITRKFQLNCIFAKRVIKKNPGGVGAVCIAFVKLSVMKNVIYPIN